MCSGGNPEDCGARELGWVLVCVYVYVCVCMRVVCESVWGVPVYVCGMDGT